MNDFLRPSARRAAAYVIFLATALMVTVLGLTALAARRVEVRRDATNVSANQARLLARSALELAMSWMAADKNWRRKTTTAPWNTDLPLSGGTVRVQAADPLDGDIGDSQSDPVLLRGTGSVSGARQVLQVTLSPAVAGIEQLRASFHTDVSVTVTSGKTAVFDGGPLWTAGTVANYGWIVGNVEAQAVTGSGYVFGSVSKPPIHTDVKETDVWDRYASVATTIAYTGDLNGFVLAPGYNPWGSTSTDGVYLIDTGNRDFRISDARIHGTLLVNAGVKKLILDGQALLHPARTDFAVLIVKGNLELRLNSSSDSLSEATENYNFNRAGAPYEGVSDSDKFDTYPNRILGLVFVTGAVTVTNNTRVDGVLLANGTVTIDASPRFNCDTTLRTNPPEGFATISYRLQQGSWTRVVD